MKAGYRAWLEAQKYAQNTVAAQMHRAGRVEEFHGDLDENYARDRMTSLLQNLTYSAEDKRRGLPNPSKIPFDGDVRGNIASYRDAVMRYRKYRDASGAEPEGVVPDSPAARAGGVGEEGQRIGLERDMQAALRIEIAQLEPGLHIIDDGAERSVDSGFIDITARDGAGNIVVIELKAGRAGRDAVGQVLSYMGDVAAEEGSNVRGILVAFDFDGKAKAAARMVPNLILRRYSVKFAFSDGHA